MLSTSILSAIILSAIVLNNNVYIIITTSRVII